MTSAAGVDNSHDKRRELPIYGARADDITSPMYFAAMRDGATKLLAFRVIDPVYGTISEIAGQVSLPPRTHPGVS